MNSVVIGSGFGGIAAALRLEKHNVTLVEKQNDLGVEQEFLKNGFTLMIIQLL